MATEIVRVDLSEFSPPKPFSRGWILRYRGCIHLTATSSGRFNTFFLLLQIALLQGWIPLLVVDSLSFFFASMCTKGSACSFGHAALKARVSLSLPLRCLRSVKITLILPAASWPVRSTVLSFGAQALTTVRCVRTALAHKS